MPPRTFLPLEEQTCFKVAMHMHLYFPPLCELNHDAEFASQMHQTV